MVQTLNEALACPDPYVRKSLAGYLWLTQNCKHTLQTLVYDSTGKQGLQRGAHKHWFTTVPESGACYVVHKIIIMYIDHALINALSAQENTCTRPAGPDSFIPASLLLPPYGPRPTRLLCCPAAHGKPWPAKRGHRSQLPGWALAPLVSVGVIETGCSRLMYGALHAHSARLCC